MYTPALLPAPLRLACALAGAAFLLAAAHAQTLNVDPKITVRPFDKKILGSNVSLFQSKNFYPTLNPRLKNTIQTAGLSMLRFPAGDEGDQAYFDRTNTYEWHQGPSGYTRTIRADTLDAFISLCNQVGAEPIIIVNAEANNAAMAADLVKYCNVDNNYNVKYWEIGNEPQYWGGVSVSQYATILGNYATAMKAVSPSISINSSAAAQPTQITPWLTPVLQAQGPKFDGVTIHWYPLYDGMTDPANPYYPSINNLLRWTWTGTGPFTMSYGNQFVRTDANSLVNQRNQYAPKAEIGITELAPVAGGNSLSGVSDTVAAAVWYGDILGRLAYNGVDYANQYLVQGEDQKYALIDDVFTLRPGWYTFVMYFRYFGDVLVQSSSTDEANVTVWASKKTGVANTLYVTVINKHQTASKTATIQFANFSPASTAQKWVLSGPSVSSLTAAINGVSATASTNTLPAITPQSVTGVTTAFTSTFPAHSMTCFKFTGTLPGVQDFEGSAVGTTLPAGWTRTGTTTASVDRHFGNKRLSAAATGTSRVVYTLPSTLSSGTAEFEVNLSIASNTSSARYLTFRNSLGVDLGGVVLYGFSGAPAYLQARHGTSTLASVNLATAPNATTTPYIVQVGAESWVRLKIVFSFTTKKFQVFYKDGAGAYQPTYGYRGASTSFSYLGTSTNNLGSVTASTSGSHPLLLDDLKHPN